MSTTEIVLIVVVVLLVIALGVVLLRRQRSERLQEHFGPEYQRRVTETGDRRTAEAELTEREKRRKQFDIRELRSEEHDRFRQSWNEIQNGFVDDPERSLHRADQLVVEIMRTRGYPVEDDFDRRADDLSVDHPKVVQHYREAREVHEASVDGAVDTERQRRAITSYRSLVDALLGPVGHDRAAAADPADTKRRTRRRKEPQR